MDFSGLLADFSGLLADFSGLLADFSGLLADFSGFVGGQLELWSLNLPLTFTLELDLHFGN